MTIEPFALHPIIKKLAEAEWPCPACSGAGGFTERTGVYDVDQYRCEECVGTGRIVPFASLRVTCPYDRDTRNFHVMIGMLAETDEERNEKPPCCEGRNWIPEPDVEKARWRIAKVLADDVNNDVAARHLVDNLADDSILLLAEASLDGKMRATP